MDIVETITLGNGRRVELCLGDLTSLPRREWFDAVVVSAFTGDFRPTASSLIGALEAKGVSVERLAAEREIDYTSTQGTWLSKPFAAASEVVKQPPGGGHGIGDGFGEDRTTV